MAKYKAKKPVQVWGVKQSSEDYQPAMGADYHPDEKNPAHGLGYKDNHIERQPVRMTFGDEKGALSVAVEAGEERLGELYVSTQFEVTPGDHPGCVANHEAFTGNVNEWLKQILDNLLAPEVEVEVSVDVVPHPKHPFDLNVERAIAPLVGEQAVNVPVKADHHVEADHKVNADVTVRTEREAKL